MFDFLKDVKYLVTTLPKTQVKYLGFLLTFCTKYLTV